MTHIYSHIKIENYKRSLQMIELRKQGKSLQSIGNKFGISREREFVRFWRGQDGVRIKNNFSTRETFLWSFFLEIFEKNIIIFKKLLCEI